MQTQSRTPDRARGTSRVTTTVKSVDELVGAHPVALQAIFGANVATDPEELGESPRGLLLTLNGLSGAHLALRPAVRALSRGTALVWRGLRFDHGGNSGVNRLVRGESLRFHAERGPSKLDGAPALVLTYEKSPWPLKNLRDELRTVSSGVAMGPTYLGDTIVAWFGLSRE